MIFIQIPIFKFQHICVPKSTVLRWQRQLQSVDEKQAGGHQSLAGPTFHGPRKKPWVSIIAWSQLTCIGVRWDSVPFNFWWKHVVKFLFQLTVNATIPTLILGPHPAKNMGSCKYHQIFTHVPWLEKQPARPDLLEELKNNHMEITV